MSEFTKGERITRKEIKLPGPDHPISIEAADAEISVMVPGHVVAQSAKALPLEEKGYHPPSIFRARMCTWRCWRATPTTAIVRTRATARTTAPATRLSSAPTPARGSMPS
jgi:uncharacterized protein (DUF427 family)